ncbi:MAG: hypothetical protein Q3962_07295 [Corynebacterium sp.]|nr:hypothetical protein [Corynebacterium sp.]
MTIRSQILRRVYGLALCAASVMGTVVAVAPQAGAVTVAATDAGDRCILTFSQQEMQKYETTLNALVEKFDGLVKKINPNADFSQKPAAIQALKTQHKVDAASGQFTFLNNSLKEWEMPYLFRPHYVLYGAGSASTGSAGSTGSTESTEDTVYLDDLTEIPRDLAIYAHALGVIDAVNDQSINDMAQYFDKDAALAWLDFFNAADGLAMIQGADRCAGLTALTSTAEGYEEVSRKAEWWADEARHTIEEGPNYPPIDGSPEPREEDTTSRDEPAILRDLMDSIVNGSSKVSEFAIKGAVVIVTSLLSLITVPVLWVLGRL